MIVAIDGPAGAGKTTVSQKVASALGFIRLDTGALYRAVALAATRAGLTVDSPNLREFVEQLDIMFVDDEICLSGERIEALIRTPEISQAASAFSAQPGVRAGLLELQRAIGRRQDAVVDGRDIGTVVFPKAEVKVFLTASVEERARRRWAELMARGERPELAEIRDAIAARDAADMGRETAPLKQAADAVLLDSTTMDIEQVVSTIVQLASDMDDA